MDITDRFLAFSLLGAEWVMWVLVALSLASVTVMVERAIYFSGKRRDIFEIIEEMKKLLAGGDSAGAIERLKNEKGVVASVVRTALTEAKNGPSAVDEAATSATIQERLRLERNLAFLGTIGNNAPFIGLFGTVIGIIQAFHDLSKNTQGGTATVMAGISEALVATAIGLLVAIPAVIAFNIFQRRIKAIMGDVDSAMHALLATLKAETGRAGE